MTGDDRPHTLTKDCWCDPTAEYVPGPTSPAYRDIESEIVDRARILGQIRRERDLDWLRLVLSGTNQFQANHSTDAEYGSRILDAETAFEIALARLRR